MAHDALAAHARDELGLSDTHTARPIQAALASAMTFALGAAMPLLFAVFAAMTNIIAVVSGSSLLFLALLGALASKAGDASVVVGAARVTFWGAFAMALTAAASMLFGPAV
jgi:VIT1/CCC1 family predicted Fe2+/Mn2+ transporter